MSNGSAERGNLISDPRVVLLSGPDQRADSCAWSPSGNLGATVHGGTCVLWDLHTGAATVRCATGRLVRDIAFDGSGRRIMVLDDHSVSAWSGERGNYEGVVVLANGYQMLSIGGYYLAAWQPDRCLLQPMRRDVLDPIEFQERWKAVVLSADGLLTWFLWSDGVVAAHTGAGSAHRIAEFPLVCEGRDRSIVCALQGRRAVVCCGGHVHVFDCDAPERQRERMWALTDPIHAATWLWGGRALLLAHGASRDASRLCGIDVATGFPFWRSSAHTLQQVTAFASAPDGHRVLLNAALVTPFSASDAERFGATVLDFGDPPSSLGGSLHWSDASFG
ncbi:hypothetical protein HYV74_03550 [Candidatus Uhrbacteria bacterium]|nr:hypothetical protein [Candidatus Uhrbacteria bacterium]